MRPRKGFSRRETRGATKYANRIANRKSESVSRAACRKANPRAKMKAVHRIRAVFGSQTLLSMSHLRPFDTEGPQQHSCCEESILADGLSRMPPACPVGSCEK